MSADLYGKGHLAGEPHTLMVVCHARLHSDGGDPPAVHPVGRYPTIPEVLTAGDLLTPGDVFHILFICVPVGVTREPVALDGALGVQADQVGEATVASPRPLIHAAQA